MKLALTVVQRGAPADCKDAAALVPGPLVEGLSLVGDRGFVRDRIDAYRDVGVTMLDVEPVGADRLADVEAVAGMLA